MKNELGDKTKISESLQLKYFHNEKVAFASSASERPERRSKIWLLNQSMEVIEGIA